MPVLQRDLVFQIEEVYVSGTIELPMEALILASFFFFFNLSLYLRYFGGYSWRAGV